VANTPHPFGRNAQGCGAHLHDPVALLALEVVALHLVDRKVRQHLRGRARLRTSARAPANPREQTPRED
jgi:hypothetical protein